MRDSNPNYKLRKSYNTPGDTHEITFSTHEHRQLLSLPGVSREFLANLDQARAELDLKIYAYVVMPEHCHLLIKPTRDEYFMAEILSAIKGRFAKDVLKRREGVRSLALIRTPKDEPAHRFWERGGGFDRNINSERYIRNCINYIHMNPVRRKLCEGIGDWPWSSARGLDGGTPEIAVDYPEF